MEERKNTGTESGKTQHDSIQEDTVEQTKANTPPLEAGDNRHAPDHGEGLTNNGELGGGLKDNS